VNCSHYTLYTVYIHCIYTVYTVYRLNEPMCGALRIYRPLNYPERLIANRFERLFTPCIGLPASISACSACWRIGLWTGLFRISLAILFFVSAWTNTIVKTYLPKLDTARCFNWTRWETVKTVCDISICIILMIKKHWIFVWLSKWNLQRFYIQRIGQSNANI